MKNLLNRKLGGFVLFAIMMSAVGTAPVFGSPAILQNSTGSTPVTSTASSTEISVTTDKTSYDDGEKITISGSTQDYVSNMPITVRIISPIGNIVKVDQVDLGSDRTFSTSLTATGILWQAAGAYKVLVQYGNAAKSAETTFLFAGSTGVYTGQSMKIDGTDFSVKYSITNGKVIGMKVDTNSKSLIVSIQTTGDGILTVILPRGLIDAKKSNNIDAQFAVMTDGQESTFEETGTTATYRILSIPFVDGTTQIDIVGTFAIPEFGVIASVVLAIAIMSIIVVSAKTGLRFTTRHI